MRRLLAALVCVVALGAAAVWWLTRPETVSADTLAGLKPGDAGHGEAVFDAAGCAGCHAAEDAEGEARLRLGGGRRLASPFGTFVTPNISPDPEHGIGGWDLPAFADAMLAGVSPGGQHLYPAFPYGSYTRAAPQDIADLKAYMDTLPAVARANDPNELPFPFNIRRGIGVWKRLYLRPEWVLDGDLSEAETRGRYLVEALGHCGQCHTPRTRLGGLERDEWLAGAPNPSGDGDIPNITPGGLDWSKTDIAYFLKSGLTPDYDSAGGDMTEVIDNLSRLPDADRQAIAAYLKAVPAVE